MERKEPFQYTYSAKTQEEIKAIRKKYTAPEQNEDKMETLRRLDGAVTQKATTVSLIFGILGALILGTGMSLILTDVGQALGTAFAAALGMGLGIFGILLVCLAYPVYNRILTKERKKIAPEIIRLTDELIR